MTGVYRAALALAAKGIAVFPCAPNAKNPLTKRGLHDASTDPDVICEWAQRWPAANLATPTGLRSGLLVIDVDCKHDVDGRETLRSIEADLGALPATSTSTTPSGGEHRWFRMPACDIRNSAGRLLGMPAPGFDVRAEGGYVLVPPSTVDGRAYEWSARVPPAELPAAWVNVLAPVARETVAAEPWKARDERERTRAERWCLRALQTEARELASAPQGTRNDHLWRSAAALAGLVHVGAIDAEDVRRALIWACSNWGSRTPRKDHETIERGIAFGLANPRTVTMGEDTRAA